MLLKPTFADRNMHFEPPDFASFTNRILKNAGIDFSDGPTDSTDPLHTHPHEQITYVAEGEIMFVLEDQKYHLKAGDLFTVAGNMPHSVQLLTEKVRLVDTFTPIREDFL
jgi:mannose-6-phosphate isomerase-like protein (cupin superfamily)